MRKMISFKIENLPEKEQVIVDDWADGQKNINQSLANLVMHIVAWAGNTDVMDFEVQQKLHSVLNSMDAPVQPVVKVEPSPVTNKPEPTDPISKAAELFDED